MLDKQKHKHRSFYRPQEELPKPPIKADTKSQLILKLKKTGLFVWGAFKRFCFLFGFMMLISTLAWGVLFSRLFAPVAPQPLPDEMVLFLKLDKTISETNIVSPFDNPFEPPTPTFYQLLKVMRDGGNDERVKGLVVRMETSALSLSQVQEFRSAIKAFKSKDKFAYIYAPSYGSDGAGGLGQIYLASVFDQRWLHPMGVVSIDGIRIEMPFIRDALDKIGITPNFYQRKKYKTAYESVTNSEMSAANKEELNAVINAIRSELNADISNSLDLDEGGFDALVHQGLFTGDEALQAGLVTHLNYVDQLIAQLSFDLKGDKKADLDYVVPLRTYAAYDEVKKSHHMHGGADVALIHVSGAIVSTNSSGYSNVAAADKIAAYIWDAGQDKSIKAIVLRIDSPGGSPVASDTILRALTVAKENGKKIIVSMGGTAASGGYWVASGADYVFANAMTLTGSIGVVGGKIATNDLWSKLDVNWDRSIAWGDNAGMWSVVTPFSKGQEQRINAMLDNVYDNFIDRVAKGRDLSPQQVEEIAQGRVWAGRDALDNGLVDQLGGLEDALVYTAHELGKETIDEMKLVSLPKELSPIEKLFKLLGEQSMIFEGLKIQAALGHMAKTVFGADALSGAALLSEPEASYIYEDIRISQ